MHQSDECPVHKQRYFFFNKKTNPSLSCQSFFWFFFTPSLQMPHFHTQDFKKALFLGILPTFDLMFRFDVDSHGWGKLSSDKATSPCNTLPSFFGQCNNQT